MEPTAATPPEASPPDDLAAGILDALAEPALLVTARGTIVRANAAAAEVFAIAAAELRERTLTSLIIPDDEAVTSRFLGLCARSRSPLPGAFHLRARRAARALAPAPPRRPGGVSTARSYDLPPAARRR